MELFLGRLHPLIVHFPIALLMVAWVMDLLTIGGKRPGLRQGIYWMVGFGAISAVFAALFGWFLRTFDDYSGELVQQHQNLGIITAALALLSYFILRHQVNRNNGNLRLFRFSLTATIAFLVFTSHLGGSLTHGEDFLTSALPGNSEPVDHSGSMELLAELQQVDSYQEHQLERLNLEVRAIFARNCYQCHSENKKKGELVLEHKEGVFQGGESGEVIVAGSSSTSELFRRVSLPSDHDEVMPKKGKVLKDHQVKLIKLWIDQGAYWSDRALEIFPEAPLALTKPALPENSKFQHPVDQLVDQYFQQEKISWEEPVGDRIFLRRVYLDITGLLPDYKEVKKFTEDTNPNKREQVVEDLLNQNHQYTQHWLSFWNDLLRNDYSGTGFITGGRKQITNWLYQSLATNKPYNQMVRELVNPSKESEGFIKGIQWRGVVNASQRTEMQAAQNVSQSLMGMNLKCASCHNSFVSNLTLEQAYSFASVFADSALELNRCEEPLGKFAQPRFLYSELGSVQADSVKERLLKLSTIITKPDNGRLYRTITNRIWKQLAGRGLVEPVDEMDTPPWNQELLDWLAADFIASGYNLKHLIRTILTSRAYQLPSVNYKQLSDLVSADYKFQGPVVRRLSAEQFSDAVSQVIGPVYYAVAYSPESSEFSTNRIWHREIKFDRDVLPEPGDRYFRYTFDAGMKKIQQAPLLISVDHSFELYINANLVASGNDWRKATKLNVSNQLQPGANIIAIKGTNEGKIANPAGILMAMKIIEQEGDTLLITSGKDWKSTDQQPEGNWTTLAFDDSEWKQVRDFGSKHWDRLVELRFDQEGPQFARASLVRQHPFMKALGRPSRENVATSRDDRATLLQALELTNGAYFNEVLGNGASAWLEEYNRDSEVIATTLYHKSFGRLPTNKELKIILETLGETPDQQAVQDLFWATVLSPEFQFVY